ncbi:LysR substrate-binding domain-containing protein [Kosakonia sp. BK9b]|uniref:LysR substrate-binding domain-containing protein n=1 Tax=Kosakonia sp. TaxID=1916651 RepID=UPI00289FBA48|nr:LysR substrate-binding domain-containing protein [Kosakonia sp.]
MKRLLSLPHLPSFEAAARLESFSAAAEELFLTTGAVSRHIRSLEAKLGVALFYRGHRYVRLTQAGVVFSRVASRLLQELAAAEQAVTAHARSHILVVQSLPTFAMHWLMPRLAAFNEAHPDISVEVTTGMGAVNRSALFDVAIRRDPAHFTGLKAIPFLQEHSVLVCSQAYLQQHAVRAADDLRGHTMIHIRAREDLWQYWLDAHRVRLDPDVQPITLDQTFAAIQAAEDGLGLAVIPHLFCARHLAAGRLVSPFPQQKIKTGNYFLLPGERDDDTVRTFIDWLTCYGE